MTNNSLDLLDGWKALNFNIFKFVDSGIHFSDNDIGIVFVFVTQLLVDGCQLFAVTAPRRRLDIHSLRRRSVSIPWGDECNEDGLLLVERDFVEVLADENFDGCLVPIFWNVLGEQVWLELAGEERIDELGEARCGDGRALGFVFAHFVFQGDQTHGGHIGCLQAEEFQDTFILLFAGIDGDEECLRRAQGTTSAT